MHGGRSHWFLFHWIPRSAQRRASDGCVWITFIAADKTGHLFGSGRQSDEVEMKAAKNGARIRFTGRVESRLFLSGTDKGIDRVPNPFIFRKLRGCGGLGRDLVGPMLPTFLDVDCAGVLLRCTTGLPAFTWIRCTHLDPLLE